MSQIVLYQLGPSPNSIKVRLALKLKGLEYELVNCNPMDRAPLIEATGQPLTPAMIHGTTVVYDSHAILRYLDANFRETRRLFPADIDSLRLTERWEQFSKSDLVAGVGMTIGQFFAGQVDEPTKAEANKLFNAALEKIEERLTENGPYLVGDALTAADLSNAPMAWYGMLPESAAEGSPLHAFFREHLTMEPRFERCRAWVDSVMSIEA